MAEPRALWAVNYHYVRDFSRTRFPRIKGMDLGAFEAQVDALSHRYEMASLESALEFLAGRYEPARDLCLLTFDDGLREHAAEVAPILSRRKIAGLFFLITSTIEENRVTETHKNHFLLASLPFAEYRAAFLAELAERFPEISPVVDTERAVKNYRWDDPEVAAFKFLLNFGLPDHARRTILNELFARHLGDEAAFAKELHVSWSEARAMQAAGMILGGHSHQHIALSSLDDPAQQTDLARCDELLRSRLSPQPRWPFAYPYGKSHTFKPSTADTLRKLGVCCAFATEVGVNHPGQDLFSIRRLDPKEIRP